MSRQHLHECARECGRVFTCDLELCPGEWICPHCEDNDRNDYFTQLELQQEQATQPTGAPAHESI